MKKYMQSNQDYFEDFITRSTYHSNAIEGNTLSMASTYAIIFNDNSVKIHAEPKEIHEAINHKYAIDYMMHSMNDKLNEIDLISIAKLINKNINEISGYRTTSVFIRGAEHIPPVPSEIKQRMMYFTHNYNTTSYDTIFEKISANHIAFEQIHPFSDGNGRTGRILMNYELLKNNLPMIVINKDDKIKIY